MAYNQPILKLTFGGSVSGEDIWTNGLSIGGNDQGDSGAIQAFEGLEPDAFATIAQEFYADGPNHMASFNTLEWIKMALVGPDGKYVEDAKIYDYPAPVQGAGNFSVSPHDTIVLSLLTGVKRGLARRGRIYLPAGFGQPEGGTGRLSASTTGRVAALGADFIGKIDDVLRTVSPSADVVIASSVGAGATREVIAVEVGNLMDNQSRRRNRLFETYSEEPVEA